MRSIIKFCKNRYTIVVVVIGVLIGSSLYVGFSPLNLAKGLPNIGRFIGALFPPDISIMPSLMKPALDTVMMAFVGTSIATVLSIPLALLAAGNVMPYSIVTRISRVIIGLNRVIPDIVFALIFIAAVGLGTFPGTLALAIHSIGMLGKLYRERIEEVDASKLESIMALGGNRLQMVRYAVMPEVLPSMVSNTLFRFDHNMRQSIVMGFVGAGGLGFKLIVAMRLFRYNELLSILLVTFILVLIVEFVSDRLRKRLIGNKTLG